MQKQFRVSPLLIALVTPFLLAMCWPAVAANSADCSSCASIPHGAILDLDTAQLSLPRVRVDGVVYEVRMELTAITDELSSHGFKLIDAQVQQESDPSIDIVALNEDGSLDLEMVTVYEGGEAKDVIRIELQLLTGSSPAILALRTFSKSGRAVFRYDTFGDEQFWTDTLEMNEVIATQVSPALALAVGLQVDADAIPEGFLESADLNDPQSTVALLALDAVVGLKGDVENGELRSVGITCALCHSRVDNSVAPGIGSRLDGFANRALNTGAILSLSPAFADSESQSILNSWGPGRHDPRFNQDGINHPVLIPPVYGLEGVPLATYTGDGPISYWNAYVGVTQMGGQGDFFDPRINVEVFQDVDRVGPNLPPLYEYQISLDAPPPPVGSFDPEAADRGRELFDSQAMCGTCHTGPLFTDSASRLHAPSETGMEPLSAQRSATGFYRTTPLRALWEHPPYFHDGSAPTLGDVVQHYNSQMSLGLSNPQLDDLVEYLKSL